jgi:hypothetical protein
MSSLAEWPALGGASLPPSLEVSCERAIWGKAQGATSDFRWLARSAGFDSSGDLERNLTLGAEDRPESATFWRRHGSRWYGGACYPSRAKDAAGRQDFLEKQLLQWAPPADLPAVLGAAALLPVLATFDDSPWWLHRNAPEWERGDFAVAIAPEPIAISLSAVGATLARGLAALQPLGQEALTVLYAGLLAGRRPTFLCGVGQPLAPEALAALLLPLARERADALCLAAWLPASRLDRGNLSGWDLLAVAQEGRPATVPDPAVERQAVAWARALLAGDPGALPTAVVAPAPKPAPASPAPVPSPLRPRPRLALIPPPDGAPEPLPTLYELAAAPRKRWWTPQPFQPLQDERAGEMLLQWIGQLAELQGDADADQWQVKIDLLRSAALALLPSEATAGRLGPFAGRIPPLLYLAAQGKSGYLLLARLGAHLEPLLKVSLQCPTESLCGSVRSWLQMALHLDGGVQGKVQRALQSVKRS